MNKIALRTAVAAAVIAPVLVLGAGPATAVPTLSAGATGEINISTPAGESWNCFGFDSMFKFGAGAVTLQGYASGSTVTVFCFGNMAPFFFMGTATAGI